MRFMCGERYEGTQQTPCMESVIDFPDRCHRHWFLPTDTKQRQRIPHAFRALFEREVIQIGKIYSIVVKRHQTLEIAQYTIGHSTTCAAYQITANNVMTVFRFSLLRFWCCAKEKPLGHIRSTGVSIVLIAKSVKIFRYRIWHCFRENSIVFALTMISNFNECHIALSRSARHSVSKMKNFSWSFSRRQSMTWWLNKTKITKQILYSRRSHTHNNNIKISEHSNTHIWPTVRLITVKPAT